MLFSLLIILFLAIPFVELWVLLQVADSAGLGNTIFLLALVSIVGAWLVRREGLGVLRRAQKELAEGNLPGRQLVDGLLVLFGGALMLTPGFFTDALGFTMLFPPTRFFYRAILSRRLLRRAGGSMGETTGGVQWVYSERHDEPLEVREIKNPETKG
ncbi:MAG TPA: FxsA family protein [Acidimicrobiia bacterium]|jgi:UPF0716 protein FxsA|nr:FxsA family protein [Acidimicrobiia bacterium]HIL47036.1 FxsA family protein [Acidimicrobiia bacterium]